MLGIYWYLCELQMSSSNHPMLWTYCSPGDVDDCTQTINTLTGLPSGTVHQRWAWHLILILTIRAVNHTLHCTGPTHHFCTKIVPAGQLHIHNLFVLDVWYTIYSTSWPWHIFCTGLAGWTGYLIFSFMAVCMVNDPITNSSLDPAILELKSIPLNAGYLSVFMWTTDEFW